MVIGNILESDFSTILESSQLVRSLLQAPYPIACAGCRHLAQCMGGAKCITYGQLGTLDAKDPNCSIHPGDPLPPQLVSCFE